ncbi:type VI secretion system contractile sheath large subunit [Pendulispora rubella]|uniref:Type VI secretion system contractile sheath large subunit n=1 Tax=Pendulispora rubella TaxID=2741070 RepID=A0ABZ2LBZ3_9BACT
MDGSISALLASQARIDRLIAKIDAMLGEQLDAILHHPEFQALEAAWRGLEFVVNRIESRQGTQVAMWNCSKQELSDDLADAAERTKSRFFRTVYESHYGQHGGVPFAAIFAGFSVTAAFDDVALLRAMASVAAMSHAPVFVDADPGLFAPSKGRHGSPHDAGFEDLSAATDLGAMFEGPSFIKWHDLRTSEDSRYLGILLPRMRLRLPYRDATESADTFVYDETIGGPGDHLWGSATYAFSLRLAESYARDRTAMGLLDTFLTPPPVFEAHEVMGDDACKPPVEVLFSRRLEEALADQGFIPLTCDPVDGSLRFASASSLQMPKTFGRSEGGEQATLNYLLGTRMPYLMFVCRFAHQLKVFQREKLGGHHTREQLQTQLTARLRRYVDTKDNPSAATRFQYPLRGAKVELVDVPGQPGWYGMNVVIRPHVRYRDAEFELDVTGRIDRR